MGFETNEIIAAMPGVLSLAAAGQMDLARTSDIASNILTGFQLNATETMRVVDVMAKTMTTSNTNIEQLGYAMKYVAPVAASLNVSIEETSAAVAKLSDAGIQGEMAGTQLRAMMLRLVNPSREMTNVMDKLGIKISDAAGNVLPFTTIIGQFEESFKRLTEAQRVEVAGTIAGQEAASGFLTLISNGKSALDSYAGSLQNAGGTAQKIADTQMDTLNGSIQELTSALEAVGITIGDKFAPAVRAIAVGMTDLLLGFNNMNPVLQSAIIAFAAASTAALGLAAAIGAVTIALRGLGVGFPLIGAISLAVGALVAGITALVTANNEAEESTRKFAEAKRALNEELNRSPLNRTVDDLKKLQEQEKELTKLLDERASVQQRMNEIQAAASRGEATLEMDKEIYKLNESLEEFDEKLKGLGFENFEVATAKAKEMGEAIESSVPALMELQRAELQEAAALQERVTSMERLSKRYHELSGLQSVDQAQKQELVQIAEVMKKQYPQLNAHLDEQGRLQIVNIDNIDKLIASERSLADTTINASLASVKAWETQAEAQRESIEAQIKNLEKLAQALAAVSNVPAPMIDVSGTELGNALDLDKSRLKANVDKELNELYGEQNKAQVTLGKLAGLRAGLEDGNLNEFKSRVSGPGVDLSSPKKTGGKKEKKGGKSPEELAAEARKKAYDAEIASIRYLAEMYDWSADRQITAYKKVQTNHKQHLAASVEDNRSTLLQIKRLQEDSVKARFDASTDFIAKEEQRLTDAGKRESDVANAKIAMWERLRGRYAKNTEFYKQADEQVRAERKRLAQAKYEDSSVWIDKEEQRMRDAGKTEEAITEMKLASWERIRDRHQKDSEYYKRADEQAAQERRQLLEDQYDSSDEWITREERRMRDSGRTEEEIAQMKIAAWTRTRDRYVKGTELYKRADEELYQSRKELVEETEELAEKALDDQKRRIDEARNAELKSIEDRKKAFMDEHDAKIRAIDDQLVLFRELIVDEDYETQLAKKRARLAELQSAVGPDGIKEREALAEEIERMELERQRELQKRGLENQKQSLQDEKSQRESAFEREKSDAEAKYDALKSAFDNFSGNVQSIESAISAFRIQSNTQTNATILSDLDTFVASYNAKMAQLTTVKSGAASTSPAGRVAENSALSSFGLGGNLTFNQNHIASLFRLLDAPTISPKLERNSSVSTHVTNHIDMSVSGVTLTDKADVATLYDERDRVSHRLQAKGVK
ncbi:phage tail tape measure protein [Paenibacillus sp. SC116]|uniref:phage tail tape measure protein n=1 Tax=Paenibacillus sp. SC116 TaxID=2968986 RepID=UPI00215A797B|nr:phage tail tape measure protein [Paenibacillus sp. SC116]MCR8843076.1 phage tail tape measure protein [Paenibacillus sp. SC116]